MLSHDPGVYSPPGVSICWYVPVDHLAHDCQLHQKAVGSLVPALKKWGRGVGSSGFSRRGRVSIRYTFCGQDSISVVGHPLAFAQVSTLHLGVVAVVCEGVGVVQPNVGVKRRGVNIYLVLPNKTRTTE